MSEIVTVRDLAMVTSDIQYAQRQGARQLASNLIEIGRLLVEAKTMQSRGPEPSRLFALRTSRKRTFRFRWR